MLEIAFWLLLGWLMYMFISRGNIWQNNVETDEHTNGGFGLVAKNNAIVIVVMQDIDKTREIYYVGELFNPESALANDKYFASFIFHSDCFESRDKAVSVAKQMDSSRRTQHGVLVYDALSALTFGEVMLKFNRMEYAS